MEPERRPGSAECWKDWVIAGGFPHQPIRCSSTTRWGDITLVHIDLYRLPEDQPAARQAFELEAIGVNDWLAQPDAWLLVEWPGRSERLVGRCDVLVEFEITGATQRRISITPHSPAGAALLMNLNASSA